MSFILDALRKAEADRDRGRVPDVNTSSLALPPQVGPGSQVRAAARSSRVWIWVAVVLACVAGGVLGAWWMRGVSADVRGGQGGEGSQGAPGGEGRQGASGERLPRHSVPRNDVNSPEVLVPRNDVNSPGLPLARNDVNLPDRPVPRNDATTHVNPEPSSRGPSDQGSSLRGPNGPKQSPTPATKPLPHTQLPADSQRVLSALQFNGLMHSEQRSARMVIVNGQVLREGDALASGLRILEIKPQSMVLRFQDQSYEWPLPAH